MQRFPRSASGQLFYGSVKEEAVKFPGLVFYGQTRNSRRETTHTQRTTHTENRTRRPTDMARTVSLLYAKMKAPHICGIILMCLIQQHSNYRWSLTTVSPTDGLIRPLVLTYCPEYTASSTL
ncbi:unnamed protein product [Boreogadus saida]